MVVIVPSLKVDIGWNGKINAVVDIPDETGYDFML